MIPQLSAVELARWRADASREAPVVVDVREPWEFELCRIDGSVSIPLGQIATRSDELPRERPLVLVCHHGGRSQHAAMLLAAPVSRRCTTSRAAWKRGRSSVDSAMKRY